MQQMSAANRFISLADDDPDDSDVASTPSRGKATAKPIDEASADSEGTEFLSVEDEEQDNPYFQQRSDQLPREQWKLVPPMDFRNHQESLRIRQELVDLFHSHKDIETPLGMDDTQQIWRWADVGARRMDTPQQNLRMRMERATQCSAKWIFPNCTNGSRTICRGCRSLTPFMFTRIIET